MKKSNDTMYQRLSIFSLSPLRLFLRAPGIQGKVTRKFESKTASYQKAEKAIMAGKLATKGFSDSKTYEDARPVYPRGTVEFLMKTLGVLSEDGSPTNINKKLSILELGAGTGKFTRVMADVLEAEGTQLQVRIVASDPLKGMCKQFKQVLPGVEMMQFPAEKIDFPDDSFDVVVACQAFHWFSNQESLSEISRVLVPEGILWITWNYPDREKSPWFKDIMEYFRPTFEKNSILSPFLYTGPGGHPELLNRIKHSGKFRNMGNTSFSYSYASNFESAFKYASSFSVAASGNEKEKVEFKKLFDKLMEKYFRKDNIVMDSIEYRASIHWYKNVPE